MLVSNRRFLESHGGIEAYILAWPSLMLW